MLAPQAVDIHSWNLSNYYFIMFHICRTIRRHFSLRQVKLCIGQRKYKQKFDWANDQESELLIQLLFRILQNSRKNKAPRNVEQSWSSVFLYYIKQMDYMFRQGQYKL